MDDFNWIVLKRTPEAKVNKSRSVSVKRLTYKAAVAVH